ncbi:MAG: bifunctional adenosylcobinamide kinase/adenosylcobinamide-phosphate guanylyltransferase [Simplicispira sp.]|nr:bifunctional adenosylcobinamide kinase/adenosylcobinamide-phosphate guanylyltransferase [Simplicispira sp.]
MNPSIARSELILGGQKSGKSRRAELLAQGWLAQSPQHRALLIATAQPWDDEMRARIHRHQRDRAERVPGMATLEEPHDLAAALARHSRPDTLIVVDCLTLWLTHWLMPATEAGQEGLDVPPTQQPCCPTPSPAGDRLGWGPAALDREAGLFAAPPAPIPAFPQGGKELNPVAAAFGGGGAPTQPGLKPNQPPALDWQAQRALFLEALEGAPGPVVLVGNEIGLGVIPMGREVRAFVDALGLLNQQVARVCQRVTLMAAGLPLSLKESER